jgi:hypothetical protein
MPARWVLAVGAAAIQLACARASSSPASAASLAAAAAIHPVKLRYHGEHRGDHPPWIYTAHISVAADTYEGRAAWRRSYRFETISPPLPGAYEGTIILDRDTLVPLEARSIFGAARQQLAFRSDRVDQTDTSPDGKVSHTTIPVQGFIATDVWAGLDLYIVRLRLKEGLRDRVRILYEDKPPRPFELSVERIEQVHVPAGDFRAFRILVTPLDNDDRMRSIYHVRTETPHLVIRKEYVVNPKTNGPLKQSTGIEVLEAIEPSPTLGACHRCPFSPRPRASRGRSCHRGSWRSVHRSVRARRASHPAPRSDSPC